MTSMINDVSDTALWVAYYRVLENRRKDALFRDPLAERLVGERGRKIAESMKGTQYTAWSVVVRTCIIDAYLRDLIAKEGVDTVLNLGAGLDTRPYRLDLPSSFNRNGKWIEVDFPHMIDLKEERLKNEKPKCNLRRVGLDLSDRDARARLLEEVSSQSSKVLVLTEGVVPYLTNEQVSELGRDLSRQKSFRFWILDYFAPELIQYLHKSRDRAKQMKNAPFRFAPSDWSRFFEDAGWKMRQIRYLADESERLGRAIPAAWWMKLLRLITPAKKRDAYRKFTGYVVLEPK